jgi:hypothetical protein
MIALAKITQEQEKGEERTCQVGRYSRATLTLLVQNNIRARRVRSGEGAKRTSSRFRYKGRDFRCRLFDEIALSPAVAKNESNQQSETDCIRNG